MLGKFAPSRAEKQFVIKKCPISSSKTGQTPHIICALEVHPSEITLKYLEIIHLHFVKRGAWQIMIWMKKPRLFF